MPSINLTYTATGPIVQAWVGVSAPRQAALTAAGIAVPNPVVGNFLVDTGASMTCVDPSLLTPLGIAPTGAIMCHTPSTGCTPAPFNQYDVMLIIPGSSAQSPAWIIQAQPVMESHLSTQGIHGLIGRDILDQAILVYNGPIGVFSLAY